MTGTAVSIAIAPVTALVVDRPDEVILAESLSEVPEAAPAMIVTFPFTRLPVDEPVLIGALEGDECPDFRQNQQHRCHQRPPQ